MTRNDRFFKLLFAIELALLPLVMASFIFTKNSELNWVPGLIVAGVLVVAIWLELFKNKQDRVHLIINAISSVLTTSSLTIFFAVYNYINVTLCVFVVLFAILMNVLKVVLHDKILPDMVNAIDSCYVLFECLLLVGLCFVVFHTLVTDIALFALLLTSVVSVSYKLFYVARYYSVFERIKNLFRRK